MSAKGMLGPLVHALVSVHGNRHGIILDIANQMNADATNGEEFYRALKVHVKNWQPSAAPVIPTPEPILALISDGTEILLDATGGTRTIAKSSKLFSGYLDPDFKNLGTDIQGSARPATSLEVHEMRRDANFADIFGSVGRPLDSLCLTQDQIIEFIETKRNWLRTEGYGTFFLFKENDEFFVAHVYVYSARALVALVYRFVNDDVWDAVYRHRVVLPQLTLAA